MTTKTVETRYVIERDGEFFYHDINFDEDEWTSEIEDAEFYWDETDTPISERESLFGSRVRRVTVETTYTLKEDTHATD